VFQGGQLWGGFGHLHTGVIRISNINAYTTNTWNYGYHPFFMVTTTGTNLGGISPIDALGWGAPAGFDPWGYFYMDTATGNGAVNGFGAWSINLFKTGEAFNYP
jgi:hypothetical protein